jgi:prepilin-type N-terminal cleavage/methylation domain-containing protein
MFLNFKRKGFTLIELLIVVAIIAILAAIAVPNFLEAQVRSKVSRQHANMRTVATAMESYMTDQNNYPLATWDPFDLFPGLYPPSQYKIFPGQLTTPISYISSSAAMEDIFRLPHNFSNPLANQIMYLPSEIYNPTSPYVHPSQSASQYRAQYDRYGAWVIRSAGPDLYYQNYLNDKEDYGEGPGGWNLKSYDPTNGTVSGGDIYRSQKKADETHT